MRVVGVYSPIAPRPLLSLKLSKKNKCWVVRMWAVTRCSHLQLLSWCGGRRGGGEGGKVANKGGNGKQTEHMVEVSQRLNGVVLSEDTCLWSGETRSCQSRAKHCGFRSEIDICVRRSLIHHHLIWRDEMWGGLVRKPRSSQVSKLFTRVIWCCTF